MSNLNNEVIFFYNCDPGKLYNNPSNPTVFTISQPYLVTEFYNYHYLNNGKLPGTIGLKDNKETTYGPWQTVGAIGQRNVANAYWVNRPNVIIPPGTYTVIDSDPSTWSQNSGSNNCGMTSLTGVLWKTISTAGDSQVTITWTVIPGATGYNVKRSTTAGGLYTTIVSNVSDTSYVDTGLTNGITYYYVVTAVTVEGESCISVESSATPFNSENSLLKIIMNDSSEREYKVTKTEVDSFIEWINGIGRTGNNCYKFADVIDESTEYLIFEKIISFKVFELK